MLKVYYGHTSLVENQQVFDQLLNRVQEDRRQKVLHYKQDKDRKNSLLAGVLLKHALEKEGLSYETLKFNKTVEGKPFLESNPNLHFSISHAGEYVVCAISDKPVGVDIESIDRDVFLPGKLQRLDAMAQKCLSENEMKKFIQSNEVEKKELFIKYWTRKEAYSKVIGKGIGMDFSTIDTETDSMRYKSNWIKEGYMLSICMMN